MKAIISSLAVSLLLATATGCDSNTSSSAAAQGGTGGAGSGSGSGGVAGNGGGSGGGVSTLFGNCTDTTAYGMAVDTWIDYTGAMNAPTTFDYSQSPPAPIIQADTAILTDGCASDSTFVTINAGAKLATQAGDLYLWLAPGSGAGAATVWYGGDELRDNPDTLRAIHAERGATTPIYLHLNGAYAPPAAANTYPAHLTITPLDPTKPVLLAEVRAALPGDDVSTLRKLRLTAPGLTLTAPADSNYPSFVALNSDARAAVTAEVEALAGGHRDRVEGWWTNLNCGKYFWIDATGELDPGPGVIASTVGQDTVVWVDFDLASNADVQLAMQNSVNAGTGFSGHANLGFPYCNPLDASYILHNWRTTADTGVFAGFPTLTTPAP